MEWEEPSCTTGCRGAYIKSTTPLSLSCFSGALDVSEGVVVAVGFPHVSQIWEEVHRGHQHKKSPLLHSSESCPTL